MGAAKCGHCSAAVAVGRFPGAAENAGRNRREETRELMAHL
jgi:hypothetical protein